MTFILALNQAKIEILEQFLDIIQGMKNLSLPFLCPLSLFLELCAGRAYVNLIGKQKEWAEAAATKYIDKSSK